MTIVAVQGKAAGQATAATSIAVTLTSAVTSGNCCVATVTWGSTTTTNCTSITDDKGNTWNAPANGTADTSNSQAGCIAWLGNITNGPITFTANFAASSGFIQIQVQEYSGVSAVSDPNDGHTAQFQSSPGTGANAVTSTAITTTVAGDGIVGCYIDSTGAANPTAGSSFTLDTAGFNQVTMANEHLTQGGAGSIAATFTIGANHATIAWVLALKAPAAASQPIGNIDQERKPWRIRQAPFDLSVPLNPNLFKNPVPTFNGDQSSSRNIPRFLPYPQTGINPNLFKNPVPTLNLYDQAHPFWPSPYRPFPDGLNPNLFKNPVPFNNGDQSSGAKINPDWAPYPQDGINPNLFTNPVPFLNQFTPVSDIPNRYPVDQALNINLYTNPYPFLNQFTPVHQPPWTWSGDQALNPNLFTNPYPIQNALGAPVAPVASTKLVDAAYNQNLYTVTVVAALPFQNLFLPPALPPAAKPFDATFNPNLFTNPYPFLNPALPPAQAVLAKPLDAVYNQNLYTVVVAAALPFNQYSLAPAIPVPSAPVDFYNLVLFQLPTNPIVATDVFTAFPLRPTSPPGIGLNPNLFTNPLPFNTYDYPQARTVPNARRELSVLLNPNTSTNPVPFNQYAYPRATRIPQSPFDLSFSLNPNLPPVVTTTFLIQRTLTGVGL